jgi:type II restriction/modification system DNA methylase subunit YeeA
VAPLDLTQARALAENAGTAFNGIQKTGDFDVPGATAREWLAGGGNPNGRPNADVLAPYWNGLDLTRRPRDYWIIDFGWQMTEADSAKYQSPFKHVTEFVLPERATNAVEALRRDWWRLWRPRPEMRKQIEGRKRYVVTGEVSKHRVFGWLQLPTLPDKNLVVIARDDDVSFGVLHSRMHELWALRLGTSLEDRPRYTPSTTFETFPFPAGVTPADSAAGAPSGAKAAAIGAAAKNLDALRAKWLNPPEWVDSTPEVVAGFPARLIPKPGREADLKKRTLTNLYNERPAWLANAHLELDAAVARAYGWADYTASMPDDEVLSRLLALNLNRSTAESLQGIAQA